MRGETVVVGIVGGVGAGKSFTTAAFVARGAAVFDADAEARRLFDEPAILRTLRERWGAAVVSDSGVVDRAKLAEIVFAPTASGRAELEFLNATTRPPLFERFRRWRAEINEAGREIAVLDAPLLFEVGWEKNVDFVVFVDASRATRERRVAERGWKNGELARREANQIALDVKRNRADFVVDSDRDDGNVDVQVEKILAEIRKRR